MTHAPDARAPFDIGAILAEREPERYALHTAHLNEQMVRVLQTIGYDVGFRAGSGQYLWDRNGDKYLDLLSGWGVFGIGRNHPTLRDALKAVLGSELPNLIQMDVSVLSGVLAERLLAYTPWLDKVFFCNSGAEAVEAAMKFARNATGRPDILYADHAYHGLTYGALSLTPDPQFRTGFGTLMPGCREVPFNDLAALDKALAGKQVAAYIVEPIQGKGVNMPDDGYLAGAQALCRKHGTLFVCDEIQTGLGRTGKFLALEHWGLEPDMVLIAKALSGGHVPVGAVIAKKSVFAKVFSRMDKAVVHGSTFAKNDMAMAAGLATLEVIEREDLVANAAAKGERLMAAFREMAGRHEFLKTVRGKGLMIGLEFGSPKSLKLKAAWSILETANAGLFSQIIVIPIFKDHRIVVQVAGHGLNVIKLIPPLTITDTDCDWIESAFDDVIADSHKVPGSVWTLGKTLAGHAMKARAGA